MGVGMGCVVLSIQDGLPHVQRVDERHLLWLDRNTYCVCGVLLLPTCLIGLHE